MLAARSSDLVGKAFTVGREAVASASFRRLSGGPRENPKSSWEPVGEDSSMVAGSNQEGQCSLVWSGETN